MLSSDSQCHIWCKDRQGDRHVSRDGNKDRGGVDEGKVERCHGQEDRHVDRDGKTARGMELGEKR